jgi:ATP-dependent 26S proteasome regulatory subunit
MVLGSSVSSLSVTNLWVRMSCLFLCHNEVSCCFRLIRELFEYTREQDECSVIFLDEVDSICRRRTSTEQDLTRRWVSITYLKLIHTHM